MAEATDPLFVLLLVLALVLLERKGTG